MTELEEAKAASALMKNGAGSSPFVICVPRSVTEKDL